MVQRFQVMAISDRRLCPFDRVWRMLPEASRAGLTAFMVREKDLAGRELLEISCEAVQRCRPLGVRVVVNDRLDVALAAGADAVHLGVAALPILAAKKIARERIQVGASAHSRDELMHAAADGADYATFGPVFETPSKARYGPPVGVAALLEAVRSVAIPVLALGGITPEIAGALAGTGIAGVAAISAILLAEDTAGAVRALAAVGAGGREEPAGPRGTPGPFRSPRDREGGEKGE